MPTNDENSKFGAGSNANAANSHEGGAADGPPTRIINNRGAGETKLPLPLHKAIQKARTEKMLSQKELAAKINVKVQMIGDYENGRAVPNAQIMGKIERALDARLPRLGKTAAEKGGAVAGAKKKVHAA
jgi:putative transcription factor